MAPWSLPLTTRVASSPKLTWRGRSPGFWVPTWNVRVLIPPSSLYVAGPSPGMLSRKTFLVVLSATFPLANLVRELLLWARLHYLHHIPSFGCVFNLTSPLVKCMAKLESAWLVTRLRSTHICPHSNLKTIMALISWTILPKATPFGTNLSSATEKMFSSWPSRSTEYNCMILNLLATASLLEVKS